MLYKTNGKVSASKSLQGYDQWSLLQGNTGLWGTGDTVPEGGNRGQPIWGQAQPTKGAVSNFSDFPTRIIFSISLSLNQRQQGPLSFSAPTPNPH